MKGLALVSAGQAYQSVPPFSGVAGNKENTKKTTNEGVTNVMGPKVSLKAREFGREITNATASSSYNGGPQTAKTNASNRSLVIDPNHTQHTSATNQSSSFLAASGQNTAT